MSEILTNYRALLRLGLSIGAAVLVLMATRVNVRAAEGHTFILTASTGYGTADCAGRGRRCSEVVASGWCEAHGYAAPIAYGSAADMTTATIPGKKQTPPPAAKVDPGAFIVTCGE